MTATGSSAVRPALVDPAVWKIAVVAMLAPLMSALDSTVVNVSLAALGRELHASLTTIQWVSSGYLLALALTLPLSGWLVDRVGAKRIYLVCFVIFTLTSVLCGTARSASALILFRVLQGAAGGLLSPLAQLMIARTAGPHMARVMGVSAMPVLIGPIFGPALAGVILQTAGWPWIFYINLPIGIVATLLAWRVLPADAHETNTRSLDWLGFLLLSPALVLLLHSLERLGQGTAGWPNGIELAAALMLLGAFLRHAAKLGKLALIDVGLFRNPAFSASAVTQFLANCMIFGGMMLFPLYLIEAQERTPGSVGVLLAWTGVGLLCTAPCLGALNDRFGPRRLATAGVVIALAATLPFALIKATGIAGPLIGICLFIRGLGLGCIGIPSVSAAYAAIAKADMPIATTAINIVQRLGGPVATLFLALSLHLGMTAHSLDAPHAFVWTFGAFCLMHVLAIPATLCLPLRKPMRT